ncbi:MAG: response regulator, partial [Candidatus Schekmanbacteria bacterium]
GERMKILFMDDDKTTQKVAREMLKTLSCEVDFASNGSEAVNKYEKATEEGKYFDIVILDIVIPEGDDGIKTLKKIRQINPKAKVIALTGFANREIITNYKKYGFSSAIEKPFTLEKLKTTLNIR